MANITFMHSEDGDWIEIYLDGKSVYGGHSITPEMLLEELGVPFESFDVSIEWIERYGVPEDLEHIPPDARKQW